MKIQTLLPLALLVAGATAADPLLEGFRSPPHAARPHTWWHWINGNVSKAGITADLEAMAAVGLGGAQMFDAGLYMPTGGVPFATDAWYDHVVHAACEAKRLGLDLTLANCSGWTSSGGPWVTPELAMKYVTHSEYRARGGDRIYVAPRAAGKTGFYADIAVVAFPTPKEKAEIPDFDRQVFRIRSAEDGPILPATIAPGAFPAAACVPRGRIVDLTGKMDAHGGIAWDAPAGEAEWTVLRIGYECNGQRNRPASPSGSGLECDKLSARALDAHFDAYIGEVLRRLPPEGRGEHGFNGVLLDSYEVHGQNWTQGFEKEFKVRAGYDITPWLPVLAGFPVESASTTDRFLRTFRRVIADLFAVNYAGRLWQRCRENGLTFYCEPYGNGPSDDLQYGIHCDVPMSEFWAIREPGYTLAGLARTPWRGRFMEARWGNRALGNGRTVASMAHVWGKPIVGAEAFTSYPSKVSGRWLQDPYSLKAQGDRVFTDGVNRMIFHRYVHQPWTPTRYPGMTMAHYGFHFERTLTWWDHGAKEWVGYLTRAQQLLRQGTFQADVLFWCGEEAPNYGTDGDVPPGYACDHCPTDALARLKVEDGMVVVPGGIRYRMLAVPSQVKFSVGPGAELERLKTAGAVVTTYADVAARLPPPDFTCDDPDVTWIHRRAGDDDIYFVANPNTNANTIVCTFRVAGKTAERWNAETGEIASLAARAKDGRTEVTLDCAPADGIFVVFRKAPTVGATPARSPTQPITTHPVLGPWSVTFRQTGEFEDCAQAVFTNLSSWTQSADEAIRYFSGTATYTLAKPHPFSPQPGRRIFLDLGDVKNIAEVTVNGRAYSALWKPPFRLDVTDAVASASSRAIELSVKVTNLWPNRLIGDAKKPADSEWSSKNRYKKPFPVAWPDWLLEGRPSPTGRRTFATADLWSAADEPLPSGLLGPVKLVVR